VSYKKLPEWLVNETGLEAATPTREVIKESIL
jgi:hypothetical protein